MTPENEFNYSPEFYLTRLLSTKLQGLPQLAQERFWERPLTVFWEAARNLITVDETIVEAGYALKHHEQNRLIYLFEPQDSGDRVPFDLNTFKYVQISQAAEIQGKVTPEIKAILEDAGAAVERETS